MKITVELDQDEKNELSTKFSEHKMAKDGSLFVKAEKYIAEQLEAEADDLLMEFVDEN